MLSRMSQADPRYRQPPTPGGPWVTGLGIHNCSIDPLFLCISVGKRGLLFESSDLYWFMLIRPLNLPLCRVTRMVYTRGPWVTRRPSNQGSKKGHPSLWLRRKNLGQGLGFCNFLPGKLPHTGTFYISSARPPIVICILYSVWFLGGTNLGITSRLLTSVHPDPLNRSLVWDGGPGPMQATAYTAFLLTEMTHFLSKMASSWSGVGFTPGGTIDSASKTPFFPQKCIKFRSKEGVLLF